jgi:hypothetical protein
LSHPAVASASIFNSIARCVKTRKLRIPSVRRSLSRKDTDRMSPQQLCNS